MSFRLVPAIRIRPVRRLRYPSGDRQDRGVGIADSPKFRVRVANAPPAERRLEGRAPLPARHRHVRLPRSSCRRGTLLGCIGKSNRLRPARSTALESSPVIRTRPSPHLDRPSNRRISAIPGATGHSPSSRQTARVTPGRRCLARLFDTAVACCCQKPKVLSGRRRSRGLKLRNRAAIRARA
jgi:hypothetical protein